MKPRYHLLIGPPEANLVAGMKRLQNPRGRRFDFRRRSRGRLSDITSVLAVGIGAASALLAIGMDVAAQSPSEGSDDFSRYAMKLRENALQIEPQVVVPNANRPGYFAGRYPWKLNIITEVCWIGEPGSGPGSAWDPNWKDDYGGPDNPAPALRHDYIPKSFTPLLNPFYCSLPYNDVRRNATKPEAPLVIPWFKEVYRKYGESVCRNRWIEIRSPSGQTCFAQWSDCGPIGTDQWQYVFGNEMPRSNSNHGAGLGVSPAVRDFLALSKMDVTSWRFVDFPDVPPGPWSYYGENNDFVIRARLAARRVPAMIPTPAP